MFQNIIIGRYVAGTSILHRMDSRAKFIGVFLLAFVIFLANNFVTYISLITFVLIAVISSTVSLRFIYKGLKPIFLLVIVTLILHIFVNKEGQILYELGPLSIHEEGFRTGIYIAIRLITLVVVTSLLTLTTTPIEMTDGLESLLNPFKKLGLPAHELALMMSISLRFIPTLLEETEKILKAQMARGVDFSSGPWKDRIKSVIPLLIPLFIGAFKRAEDLAYAMEARGYRGGEGRTRLRVLKWSLIDTAIILLIVLFGVGIYIMRT